MPSLVGFRSRAILAGSSVATLIISSLLTISAGASINLVDGADQGILSRDAGGNVTSSERGTLNGNTGNVSFSGTGAFGGRVDVDDLFIHPADGNARVVIDGENAASLGSSSTRLVVFGFGSEADQGIGLTEVHFTDSDAFANDTELSLQNNDDVLKVWSPANGYWGGFMSGTGTVNGTLSVLGGQNSTSSILNGSATNPTCNQLCHNDGTCVYWFLDDTYTPATTTVSCL